MRASEGLAELKRYSNGMFRLVNGLKIDINEVQGGGYMRGSDVELHFSVKERGEVWMDYMERIMNDENDWDHNVEGGAVVCVSREDMFLALSEMKTGNAPGPSEVSLEMIADSGGVGIQLMAKICLKIMSCSRQKVVCVLSTWRKLLTEYL